MNGELTLGENIADNGAVYTAYHAYKNSNSNQTLPFGLSDQKLLFLSFAQVRFTRFFKLRMFLIISWQSWCSLFTTAHLKTSVTYDPYCNSSGMLEFSHLSHVCFICMPCWQGMHTKCSLGRPWGSAQNKLRMWSSCISQAWLMCQF